MAPGLRRAVACSLAARLPGSFRFDKLVKLCFTFVR